MERLTTYKKEVDREMICRHEECDTIEEYCPHCNEENCPCLQEVINKLADYEDAEEQGLLLRLPCKVGDTVYLIYYSTSNYKNVIIPCVVEDFKLGRTIRIHLLSIISKNNIYSHFDWYNIDEIGVCIFLTKEEAEAKLKERERE